MGLPYSADTATPFVSIDPAVAEQIYRVKAFHQQLSSKSKPDPHTIAAGPQVYTTHNTARKEDENENIQEGSLPKSLERSKKNSLRRIKNSTDVLRQRSTRAQLGAEPYHQMSNSKEGCHFTVGNVGTGGKLYLRPAANQPQQRLPPTFLSPSPTPPNSVPRDSPGQGHHSQIIRGSVLSSSQVSDRPTKAESEGSNTSMMNLSDEIPTPSPRARAFSSSTVNDANESLQEEKDGVLRIVIDRSATNRSKPAEDSVLPTLEIPIPHYRLGQPRFSIQGTPILRSSAYTRTSDVMSEDLKSGPIVRTDFSPAGARHRYLSEGHTSDTFINPVTASSDACRDSAEAADSSSNFSYMEPIKPEVFDRLAIFKDDASVVRYSPKSGAITAATPPRIVAQISSESFMDYELVSDFFLTFRAYLSTENLLGLLLARLRWAINRLEDDGRIIRIRTFAALRHWILNYFMDDFVGNRRLRVQFCDQINGMYHEVSHRTGRGVSDLKILLDLKRCWNGKCSLYWDSTRAVGDAPPEADILPGGEFGSQRGSLAELDIVLDKESNPIADNYRNGGNMAKTWYGRPRSASGPRLHDRQAFTKLARVPISPTSEQSVQAASCSIPARAFKRSPPPDGNARGPCPMPVQPRMHYPSLYPPTSMKDSRRRLSYAHKRRASTSDSIRDRESIDLTSQPVFLASPHSGSLIRGHVYPPAVPFVDVIAPDSPPSQRPRLNISAIGVPASFESDGKSGSAGNPGVKTLMGSIRRALSSKHPPSTSPASGEEIGRSASSPQRKTSGLPVNMARSSDTIGDKKSTTVPRHHLRIDLLCAAVSQSYQMMQAKASQDPCVNRGLGVSVPDIPKDFESQHIFTSSDHSTEASDVQSVLNHNVRSSLAMIDCAIGLDLPNSKGIEQFMGKDDHVVPIADSDLSTSGMTSMALLSADPIAGEGRLNFREHQRSSSVDTALARRPKEEAKPASFHKGVRMSFRQTTELPQSCQLRSVGSISALSGLSQTKPSTLLRHERGPSRDEHRTSLPVRQMDSDFKLQGPTHTLRRRPGGNLRNIETVRDLAPSFRRQSTGSLTTRSESVGSMLFIGASKATGSKQMQPVAQAPQHHISLIRTHSSQHLRPSFEAAISGFSAIPDDEDGGLEATLLKLEGKYEKMSPEITDRPSAQIVQGQITPTAPFPYSDNRHNIGSHCSFSKFDQSHGLSSHSHPQLRQQASVRKTKDRSSKSMSTRSERSKSSMPRSEDCYSSISLLERSIVDQLTEPKALPKPNPAAIIARPLFEGAITGTEQHLNSLHGPIELVEERQSIVRIAPYSMPSDTRPHTADDSFLLDEDDNLSDLSSDLSTDVIDLSAIKSPMASSSIVTPGITNSGRELPVHPLAHPPSPAFSFHHAAIESPPNNPMMYQQKPLTPQPSPTQGTTPQGNQVPVSQVLPPNKGATVGSPTVTTSAGHIPFVLACQSEILAQQLTLVEKAALSEIEWSDLVGMKWDSKSPSILNWVEYLASKDNKGIDIVITRFNIVVKWVVSEIVMTQNIYERARAITKYIHIAAHAKQIHNYATMLQITIALTSIDCTRLKATWELVADAEKTLLKQMERLAQPIRNFHDLRVEMETVNLQDGCIPFVGLYLHDLTYNAQKPSRIINTPGSEPLVNFEKYRTTATIVKCLLRLIDASSQYKFSPIPGIIERCLWMAALSDEKITALSKSIQ